MKTMSGEEALAEAKAKLKELQDKGAGAMQLEWYRSLIELTEKQLKKVEKGGR